MSPQQFRSISQPGPPNECVVGSHIATFVIFHTEENVDNRIEKKLSRFEPRCQSKDCIPPI